MPAFRFPIPFGRLCSKDTRSTTSTPRTPLVLVSFAALSPATLAGEPLLHFSNQTVEAGLTALNDYSPFQSYAAMAGGGVAEDFNNDGFDDILLLGSLNPNALYINNQDGTFTDQAAEWGVAGPFHSYAASTADFNNDGYIDLFITSFGPATQLPRPGEFKLFMNNGPDKAGNWSFTDVAQSAGVNRLLVGVNNSEGTGSDWGDYDLDGDLDLFVTALSPLVPGNRLFRNDGPDETNTWRFTDVTAEAGLEETNVRGFLPSFADMNNDRYPELIIISDSGTSRYYTNNQDGTFTNTTSEARGIETINGMGIDIADINNDFKLDFYATNIRYNNPPIGGNVLLIQNSDGSFDDQGPSTGTHLGYWGWGALINDFDHDGHKDILENNGFTTGGFGNDPATLFLNNGNAASFTESAEDCNIDYVAQGRGLVRLDADNDGDMDAVLFNHKQPMAYFRNNLISPESTPDNAHWMRIKLDTSARDTLAPQGIGAMITLSTPTKDYLLPIHNSVSYCGSSAVETHIGLAEESQIVSIQVAWPDGSYSTWTDLESDQILTLSASAHPADYDRNGAVDSGDLFEFISYLNTRDLTIDHNGDGRVDYFDISAFIRDYRAANKP
ncbi:MAG: VCBS repeat-containing protein [Phycisphaerales bacterium]|nr:VCBS repeat-containing protein [Phycisphaerales bacterium]